eukprot:GEMP01102761.1.p1 GENE.GEMP01102761.1~~GEMP01102761.1.p1  ORF type:complete len:189 (+),score=17.61 GEMP01102761.1:164-730(+)
MFSYNQSDPSHRSGLQLRLGISLQECDYYPPPDSLRFAERTRRAPYLFTFGKHQGEEVKDVPIAYVSWLIQAKVPEKRPELKQRLDELGMNADTIKGMLPPTRIKTPGTYVAAGPWKGAATSKDPLAIEKDWQAWKETGHEWIDNRADKQSGKINPKSPDFKQKTGGVALWIDSLHTPQWVKDKLANK